MRSASVHGRPQIPVCACWWVGEAGVLRWTIARFAPPPHRRGCQVALLRRAAAAYSCMGSASTCLCHDAVSRDDGLGGVFRSVLVTWVSLNWDRKACVARGGRLLGVHESAALPATAYRRTRARARYSPAACALYLLVLYCVLGQEARGCALNGGTTPWYN
eukprot:54215-Prymnesium_polylepis.1